MERARLLRGSGRLPRALSIAADRPTPGDDSEAPPARRPLLWQRILEVVVTDRGDPTVGVREDIHLRKCEGSQAVCPNLRARWHCLRLQLPPQLRDPVDVL